MCEAFSRFASPFRYCFNVITISFNFGINSHIVGHGDTAVDSHIGLPVISKSREELAACEFVPFRRAVVEGVAAVMTAHIEMPSIANYLSEKGVPASLSRTAINILRMEMRYDGMIVSDCLEMDGVRATFGTERGAVMALKVHKNHVLRKLLLTNFYIGRNRLRDDLSHDVSAGSRH